MKALIWKDTGTPIFIAALVTIAQIWTHLEWFLNLFFFLCSTFLSVFFLSVCLSTLLSHSMHVSSHLNPFYLWVYCLAGGKWQSRNLLRAISLLWFWNPQHCGDKRQFWVCLRCMKNKSIWEHSYMLKKSFSRLGDEEEEQIWWKQLSRWSPERLWHIAFGDEFQRGGKTPERVRGVERVSTLQRRSKTRKAYQHVIE